MASSVNSYQTWQAIEELYFSHIEARWVGLSGNNAIQRRKQKDATKGFIKFWWFFSNDNLLSFLNLIILILGIGTEVELEAIMNQQST